MSRDSRSLVSRDESGQLSEQVSRLARACQERFGLTTIRFVTCDSVILVRDPNMTDPLIGLLGRADDLESFIVPIMAALSLNGQLVESMTLNVSTKVVSEML